MNSPVASASAPFEAAEMPPFWGIREVLMRESVPARLSRYATVA